MTRLVTVLTWILLGTAGAIAQDDPADDASGELAAARLELEQAREALEKAAREVARLSAEHLGTLTRYDGFAEVLGPRRPLLGINVEDADGGVRVIGVTPNGVAAKAGVMTGDVLVAIDGFALDSAGDRRPTAALLDRLDDIEPGALVELDLERDGMPVHVVAETSSGATAPSWLGDLSELGPAIRLALPHGRGWASIGNLFADPAWRGMELVTLTPALGEYFGTADGLLVVRAPDDDALGLVDGDVILTIGARTPQSVEHAMRILASFEPDENLEIEIMRAQRRQTLAVELPAD